MSDDPEKPTFEMKKTRLCDRINDPHQKIIYIYDFIELWTMHLEMTGIDVKEKAGVEYPRITKTSGLAPKQYDKVQRFGVIDDNEFDEITKNYLNKTDDLGGEISDDEADEHGLFEDEAEEGADENSFIEE
jgi:hypothetical protein